MTAVIVLNLVLCGVVVFVIDGLLVWAIVAETRSHRGHGRLPRAPDVPVAAPYLSTTDIHIERPAINAQT